MNDAKNYGIYEFDVGIGKTIQIVWANSIFTTNSHYHFGVNIETECISMLINSIGMKHKYRVLELAFNEPIL